MEHNLLELPFLSDEIKKVFSEKIENDNDVRRVDAQVKQLNALGNIARIQLDYKRVELQRRQVELNELRVAFEMGDKLAHMSEKIQKNVGKTILGLFPEHDKKISDIIRAAKKLSTVVE